MPEQVLPLIQVSHPNTPEEVTPNSTPTEQPLPTQSTELPIIQVTFPNS